MNRKLIAGAVREVVWSEQRDAGEMFSAEIGVWKDERGFVAYVCGPWGGGVNSKHHPSEVAAQADTGRLWEKFYG